MLPPHARTFSNLRLVDGNKSKEGLHFFGWKRKKPSSKLHIYVYNYSKAEESAKKPSIMAHGLIKVHVER
tara:strand:+ start:1569 stop:1778 length:210 start_codon:yes stop_codon:yes gene_type:complete